MTEARGMGAFLGHFARAYPVRTVVMVVMLVASGLTEGISIVTLLPLLELSAGGQPSALSERILAGISALGLSPSLGVLLAFIFVLMTAKGVFRWLAMRQVGYTVAQVTTDLRLRLIRVLLGARWSYLSGRSTGRMVHAISSEAERASRAYKDACAALASVFQIALYFGAAALLSWQAAIASLVLGAGVLWLGRYFLKLSRRAGQLQTNVTSDLIGRATEVIPGLKPIKAMGQQEPFLHWLETKVGESDAALRHTIQAQEIPTSFREPVFVLIMAVAFYGALKGVGLPFPVVALLGVMLYRVMLATADLQAQVQNTVHGESAFWALQDTIDEAEEAKERHEGTQRVSLQREVEFRDVTVRYGEVEVLSDATLTVPAGKLVTIVGPSGAGKTTLLDVLTGLVKPASGSVLVDGTPLSEADIENWRCSIGYVPQNPLLFHDTIYNNVASGDETLGHEDVEKALRLAGAWPLVTSLADGLEHMVGERGGRLSGGQGQRIALARALVHAPKLLILDEATSALDPELEAEVCSALLDLRGRVTIVAVSHQPALRDAADLVYRVEEGSVVYLGSEQKPL